MRRFVSGFLIGVILSGFVVFVFLDFEVQPEPQSMVPKEPGKFIEFLASRIEQNNFKCSDMETLDEHACLIFQAAYGLSGSYESKKFKLYYAIEAMNFIQNAVSTARYSLIARESGNNFKDPGTDATMCIDLGYGICGDHANVFVSLMERIGVESRIVQLFYVEKGQRSSHVGAEANIDGWRYFDSTGGAFWFSDPEDPLESILSFAEIIANQEAYKFVNQASAWNLMYSQSLDVFEYIKSKPSVVYGNDSGVVYINNPSPEGGAFDLSHIPTYVGDNHDDGSFSGISYKFEPVRGENVFQLDFDGVEGCKSKKAMICIDDQCSGFAYDTESVEISAVDATSIWIDSKFDNMCYVVLKKISFTRK